MRDLHGADIISSLFKRAPSAADFSQVMIFSRDSGDASGSEASTGAFAYACVNLQVYVCEKDEIQQGTDVSRWDPISNGGGITNKEMFMRRGREVEEDRTAWLYSITGL